MGIQLHNGKVAESLGDAGRILVGESGTEPLVRVMVLAVTWLKYSLTFTGENKTIKQKYNGRTLVFSME
jgi:phosphomannomutase